MSLLEIVRVRDDLVAGEGVLYRQVGRNFLFSLRTPLFFTPLPFRRGAVSPIPDRSLHKGETHTL